MFNTSVKLIGIILLCSDLSLGQIQLPAVYQDNMVLQQQSEIKIQGKTNPSEKITLNVSWNNIALKTISNKEGYFELRVKTPSASFTPQQLTFSTKKQTVSINNVLVGEVWLCSGQSNMEMPLSDINKAKEEINKAEYGFIRLLKVSKKFSINPKNDLTHEGWKICAPQSVKDFSAVGYLFGKDLFQQLNVPIGLIEAAWGGTAAEAWTSIGGLKDFPNYLKIIEENKKLDWTSFEEFLSQKEVWLKKYAQLEKSSHPNETSWASNDLNTTDWLIAKLPSQLSSIKDLKGYTETVWFRKEIEIPNEQLGNNLELSIGSVLGMDSTFVNGVFVGSNTVYPQLHNYQVPCGLLRSGKNVITIKLIGQSSFSGFTGMSATMYAQIGNLKIPLAGDWKFKTAYDISNFPKEVKLQGISAENPRTPSILFNAMINPLVGFSIKGVIWYQGESNTDNFKRANEYYSLFPSLIKDWRAHWGYDFPFLFVQLANFNTDNSEPADYTSARVRDAQFKALSLPNTGMATAIDIGEINDIHPKNKQDVGHRLALVARKVAYNETLVYSGPTYKGMQIEGDKIRITFENTGTALDIHDKYGYVRGFSIAGDSKKFEWAKAYRDGNELIIYSDTLKLPKAVRYNWGNSPDGNVFNHENLPALPFKTDDW